MPLRRSGEPAAAGDRAMNGVSRSPDKIAGVLRGTAVGDALGLPAERGALLVALAAHHAATRGPSAALVESFLPVAAEVAKEDAELADLLRRMEQHLVRHAPAAELADTLGLRRGVSGYVYHTV